MKLDYDMLSEEAMKQDVDLHRLFVEMIECLVGADAVTVPLPGNLRIAPISLDRLRREIRKLGYDGLKNRQWVSVIGLDAATNTYPLDILEQFIEVYGRTIKIGDTDELRIALATYESFESHLPRDPFLYCLAETALNQVLDARKIGRVEMNPITCELDAALSEQNREIAHMIRMKMGRALCSA